MHVQAQVVAGAVDHPATVEMSVFLVQSGFDVDAFGKKTPCVQVLGNDPDRGIVDVGELRAWPDRGNPGLLGGVDGVVDLSLRVAEAAAGRQGAGDVSSEQ